jgi:WD40 repeat protein/DNA-binding SARP family transcriptional activator
VRYSILGPVKASGGNGPAPLGGPKQRTVLAHLILSPSRVVPADQLIEAVWGETPPEAARGILQTYVSRLRSVLGPNTIESHPPGYLLRADPEDVDAFRFEHLLREARRGAVDPKHAVRTLSEALDLWRGPALADLADEASFSVEIARLEELRLQATEERIAAELELGLQAQSVAELESLTRMHPLRERLWEELILALYRIGRPADALAAYERARSILADELGTDPSRDLRALHERILREDPELEPPGEPLRGYRILEQIGEGAFGVVYRALQPQIGREVAIKALPPELANHPDFVRRFEHEAQIVARLEHPHIVPLYDYWREPDAAYLVMRFLRGGSLEDLLRDGPLKPEDAATILDHVASALAAAHRQGVVHRDVKPGNVLLDEEGNAYLSDFGVALDAGSFERSSGTMVRGTPSYLSPEQIRLDPASPRSDVYGLGIVLFEMLTGTYPFPDGSLTALLDRHLRDPLPPARDSRPDLPHDADEVIARATAKEEERRFTDPLELAAAFRAAVEGSATIRRSVQVRNPFKGLRAFLEADAADFYGREALTSRLIRRLGEDTDGARFLAVVGPSGSGKSSVVRAGLVPALRRGTLPGSERWFVVNILPGPHPLRELETALLGVAVDPPPALMDELEHDPLGLLRVAHRVLPDPDAELVIVLDQLEEIFTLVKDEDERAHVLASLRAAAVQPDSRVRIVTTLRADFFDEPLLVRGFGDLLAARTEPIGPMSLEELERAIVAPADRAGLVVEPSLLAAILADVTERPSALPLLQYALTELAEYHDGGVLRLGVYRRIGGAWGALARRAERLFEDLDEPAAQDACRQLFLRLVTLGEGGEDTRRRVRRSALMPLGDPLAMDGVIETYGRHRLLSFDRDPDTREPTIEIAHEAILTAWDRLRGWIDEARDDLRTLDRLAASAEEWRSSARDPSFLLRGSKLDRTEEWAASTSVAMADDDRAYLEESVGQRDRDRAAEDERRARERSLERRSAVRMRALVAVLTVAVVIAGTLTVLAVSQRNRASREERLATARELAAAAEGNVDVDPQRSMLLALAAADVTGQDDPLPEVEDALRRSLAEDREVLTIQGLPGDGLLAISPDGNLLVTRGPVAGVPEGEDPGFVVHDLRTGTPLRTLAGEPGGFTDLAYSPDGTRFAALAPDGTLIVWETHSWSRERMINLHRTISDAGGLTFSPDGRLLAAVGGDGIVSILDASSGRKVRRMRWPNTGFLGVAFSPDGRLVGAAPNLGERADVTPVWDVRTGRLVMKLKSPGSSKLGIAFSPDGRTIAVSDFGGFVRMWDARTGDERAQVLEGHQGAVWMVAYSPDGRRIATVGDDGVRVWDAEDGRELMVFRGHEEAVFLVRFTPDGERLVTGGGHTVRVWDVSHSGGGELFTIGASDEPVASVAFSPDGSRLLTGGAEVRQWDARTGEPMTAASLVGWNDAVYSPDGERFATAGGTLIGSSDSGQELLGMDIGSADTTWSVAYSPDGRSLAGGMGRGQESGLGLVFVWDAETGERIQTLGEPGSQYDHIRGLTFGPDGASVAGIAYSGDVHIWDVASGEELQSFDTGSDNTGGIALSPDGTLLATSGGDGAALWNADSGDLVHRLLGHTGDVPEIVFSRDGTLVATASEDGTARIWDASTGRPLHTLFGHEGSVTGVAFSPDGTTVATSGVDGTVREYALGFDDLVRIARSRLTRSLSSAECQRYLHTTSCPASVRAGSPSPEAPMGVADGPEGAFRVAIVGGDFPSTLSRPWVKHRVGDYTLALSDGHWRLHQDSVNGGSWDSGGSYTTTGDTITFTELMDQRCFGWAGSVRWELVGTELSFSDSSVDPAQPCGGTQGLAWTSGVFARRPWSRIVS